MASRGRFIPSISFSAAGFLACYHLGVSSCLIKKGLLLGPNELPDDKRKGTVVIGASAGAIVGSGISAGVTAEDGMNVVLELAKRASEKGGVMDCFRPGDAIRNACNGDDEYFLRRIEHGKLLRIALTDRIPFMSRSKHHEAKLTSSRLYIDHYTSIDDVVAASMLSSFVPGITGPIWGASDSANSTVRRSWSRIHNLALHHHAIKDKNGNPVDFQSRQCNDQKELLWDGGLADMWPTVDDSTIIVTPINGDFSPNPYIAPQHKNISDAQLETLFLYFIPKMIRIHGKASIGFNKQNLETMRRMLISSDEHTLQTRFRCGFDDARRFLLENNMLQTTHHISSSIDSITK